MKKNIFGLFVGLAVMTLSVSFVSCSSDDDNEPLVVNKHISFVVQNVPMGDYDKWIYVDLATGDTAVRKVYNRREYVSYDRTTGKSVVDSTVAASPANEPSSWHLAFSLYRVKTNDGQVMVAGKDTTKIEQITELPAMAKWAADVKYDMAVDLKFMGAGRVGYAKESYQNPVLKDWVLPGQNHGQSVLNKGKVYVVKFKDGSYAIIQFTDINDITGKKKAVSFDYKYIRQN